MRTKLNAKPPRKYKNPISFGNAQGPIIGPFSVRPDLHRKPPLIRSGAPGRSVGDIQESIDYRLFLVSHFRSSSGSAVDFH